MNIKTLAFVFVLTSIFSNCVKKVSCYDLKIEPVFIGFDSSDIDTFIVRKFYPGGNYQNPIDSFVITRNNYFQTSNDTTFVHYLSDGIVAGFDWQISILARGRTVLISDIISEKKTGKCGSGFLAFDSYCDCANDLLSAKQDNQVINFPETYSAPPYLYIHN